MPFRRPGAWGLHAVVFDRKLMDQQIQFLADQHALRECVLRYCRGIDRRDWALLRSAFHEDAVLRHPDVLSIDEFVEQIRARAEGWETSQHHITNHLAEIDGDVAHAETYFLARLTTEGGTKVSTGRYVSRYELREGTWRIAERETFVESSVLLHEGPGSVGFGVGSRDRSDPSYARPLRIRHGG